MTSEARAPWAVRPESSRGRLHAEPGGDARSPFQRDRDRIIHTGAFRRLQYKTQVFVFHEGDYFRTRLTHSIEVAQIARAITRRLRLDEDLAEALALAHDLGHPPFGHAGEEALDSQMRPYGGFDHNAQSLKVVTLLEARYAAFDGLNLTWETLEGLAKHNGPVRRPAGYLAEYDAGHSLDLGTHASAEAQVAALADDIAYNNHDLDDGIRARLFTLEEAAALPLIGDAYQEVRATYPNIARDRMITETVRRVINAMVQDVVTEIGAADRRARPAQRRRHPRGGRAGGRLLGADAGGEPADPRLPVPPHVPPLAGEPGDAEVEAGQPDDLPAAAWRAADAAAGMARPGRGARLARRRRGWSATTSPG